MVEFLQQPSLNTYQHRWALSPISVISDIGLSLISELPISDWESGVRHNIGYRNKLLSDMQYPTSRCIQTNTVAWCYSPRLTIQGTWVRTCKKKTFFFQYRISEWALMSISEHFRYRNDVFQSDIFVSDIGITDVDVGCRISPTLRSMSMPTYAYQSLFLWKPANVDISWDSSFHLLVHNTCRSGRNARCNRMSCSAVVSSCQHWQIYPLTFRKRECDRSYNLENASGTETIIYT